MVIIMHTWSVQDAKARFWGVCERCVVEGWRLISNRGVEAAVLVPVDEWRRLTAAARPSLKQLLLTDSARVDFELAPRGQAKRRQLPEWD